MMADEVPGRLEADEVADAHRRDDEQLDCHAQHGTSGVLLADHTPAAESVEDARR